MSAETPLHTGPGYGAPPPVDPEERFDELFEAGVAARLARSQKRWGVAILVACVAGAFLLPSWREHRQQTVVIPAGEFVISFGALPNILWDSAFEDIAPDSFSLDEPMRPFDPTRVEITRSFRIDVTEVTRAQWRRHMGDRPDDTPPDGCDSSCPIVGVSWWDALAYANAVSRAEGVEECYALAGCEGVEGVDFKCEHANFVGITCAGYRLPTEAEWEYAARADGGHSQYEMVDEIRGAWEANPQGVFRTQYGWRSPWGTRGMLDNAAEWVWDGYGSTPPAARDPIGELDARARVVRGVRAGRSMSFYASNVAQRFAALPETRSPFVGFRLVRTN